MPFGLMGFVFGLIAFTQVSVAMKRIERLERRLEHAGLATDEDGTICGHDDSPQPSD